MKYLTLAFTMLTSTMAQAQTQDQKQDPQQPQTEEQLPAALPELPTTLTEDTTQPEDPRTLAMEELFSTMGQAEFPAALKQARDANIHPQVLLEARFLHLVDIGDNAGLASMAPELASNSNLFDPDNSEIFSIKEDWLAIVHYTRALAALQQGDKAGFKKQITEAFWLSPRQGQAFAPHIDQLRLDEAMKTITLDPQKTLSYQENGKPAKLGDLINGYQATILHFWSPMSQEVQLNLPDFILTTQSCKQHNIIVLSILADQYPDILKDAETMRNEDAAKAQCTWLVDSNSKPLTGLLRIRDIPTMVIVSADGKILFNGHPSNIKFWQTIQEIAPDFKRPNNIEGEKDLQE